MFRRVLIIAAANSSGVGSEKSNELSVSARAPVRSAKPAVGMWPQMDFQMGEVHLAPGDILVGYTDGVTEAHSPGGEMFGKERLLDLMASRTTSAAEMVEHIRSHLFEHLFDARCRSAVKGVLRIAIDTA